jgi:hypothetical protein
LFSLLYGGGPAPDWARTGFCREKPVRDEPANRLQRRQVGAEDREHRRPEMRQGLNRLRKKALNEQIVNPSFCRG